MNEADAGLEKMYALLERVGEAGLSCQEKDDTPSGDYWKLFCEAMDDDFNTARGIGILFITVRDVNRILDETNNAISATVESACEDIVRMGGVLGILSESPETYFEKKRAKGLENKSIDPAVIDEMIRERNNARKSKDWKKADTIRAELEDMNIILEDKPEGTVWRVNKA